MIYVFKCVLKLILIFNWFWCFSRWQGASPQHTNKNLPPDKQFLVTRGVPCEKRIADLQKFHADNANELERDADDGWVETINPEGKK